MDLEKCVSRLESLGVELLDAESVSQTFYILEEIGLMQRNGDLVRGNTDFTLKECFELKDESLSRAIDASRRMMERIPVEELGGGKVEE